MLLSLAGVKISCEVNKHDDTVVWYKNKAYVLYGFKEEGYTRQNRIPVYSPVYIPLEEKEKYDKQRTN